MAIPARPRTMRVATILVVLLAAAFAGCVGSDSPSDAGPSTPAPTNTSSPDVGNGTEANETSFSDPGPAPIHRNWTDDAVVGVPLVGDNKDDAVRRAYDRQGTVNGTFVVFYSVAIPDGSYGTLRANLSAPQTDPVGIWPDYDLYLLDPNGTIVDRNVDVGTREEVAAGEPAPGSWTLAVWYAVGETVEGVVTEAFTLRASAM